MAQNPYEQLKMQAAPAPTFGNRRSFNRAALTPAAQPDGVAEFFGGMFDTGADIANFTAVHGLADTGPAMPAAPLPQNAWNRPYAGMLGMNGPAPM